MIGRKTGELERCSKFDMLLFHLFSFMFYASLLCVGKLLEFKADLSTTSFLLHSDCFQQKSHLDVLEFYLF